MLLELAKWAIREVFLVVVIFKFLGELVSGFLTNFLLEPKLIGFLELAWLGSYILDLGVETWLSSFLDLFVVELAVKDVFLLFKADLLSSASSSVFISLSISFLNIECFLIKLV